MSYVVWFKDLNKDSIDVAGGKGANLGEMFNIGLPVPGGFSITAQTYKEFIERTGLDDRIQEKLINLDVEDTEKLQSISKEIQEMVSKTEIPDHIKEEIIDNYELLGADKQSAQNLVDPDEVFVAVRSSATAEDLPEASFAGQQATFLNIKGKDALIKAVRDCWASLFTARAIYYRVRNNFDHSKVLISAIVQRMVNSERSGIMFTINPATNDDSEIVIEAVYGLGETIVSGSINPDFYSVSKDTKDITKKEIKKQEWGLFRGEDGNNVEQDIPEHLKKLQVVDDKNILELARLGKKIEEHYGKPQDIEWAIEKGTVYIVQARAVTTFKPKEKVEVVTESNDTESTTTKKILLKGETASGGYYSGKVKLISNPSELSKIQKGDVLVTNMTTPDMVPAMQKAGAIVTNEGGMTCHAAIVSRELGIPCLVGTEHATEVLKDDQIVTVDASLGVVYEGKIESANKKIVQENSHQVSMQAAPIITATEVKLLVDIPDLAERAAQTGADGVGLVRLEMMIAQGGIHPAHYIRTGRKEDYINLLKTGIRKIAQAFKGKPVWVRNSDMRSDEYRNLEGGDLEPKETDPMIGWHAIRRLLDEPEILYSEFLAIKELHDEGLTNIGVMLPFVIRTEEVKAAKDLMRHVGLEPCRDIDFGVMIETPASCWIIEDLCKEGISFVSFGTNDLTQLTLGIDRNNQRIQKLFSEMHPAVLGQMAKVIKTCRKYHVKTSICGQAGSRADMADFLVHQGVDSISANYDVINQIRQTVAKTERKLLLDAEREELEEMHKRTEE